VGRRTVKLFPKLEEANDMIRPAGSNQEIANNTKGSQTRGAGLDEAIKVE
jgi:hypothetical protein